jgi:hypothetical protein
VVASTRCGRLRLLVPSDCGRSGQRRSARAQPVEPGPDRVLPASSPATVYLDGVVQLRLEIIHNVHKTVYYLNRRETVTAGHHTINGLKP